MSAEAIGATCVIGVAVASGFIGLGVAKVAKTQAMRARAEHVGLDARAYQLIGVAEFAGGVGVLAGLRYPPLGFAAGAGLLVLMTGAVLAHARAADGPTQLLPAAVFAAGTLAYLLGLGTR